MCCTVSVFNDCSIRVYDTHCSTLTHDLAKMGQFLCMQTWRILHIIECSIRVYY